MIERHGVLGSCGDRDGERTELQQEEGDAAGEERLVYFDTVFIPIDDSELFFVLAESLRFLSH